MPRVRPAAAEDLEDICLFMHRHMNANIPTENWRRLFTHGWLANPPDRGYVVDDDGRIGGFMGTIYHRRRVDKRWETFCNLSSWYIAKPLRGDGLGRQLLHQALAQRESYHHCILSAARNTARMFAALDYPRLETHHYVLSPSDAGDRLWVSTEPEEIHPYLNESDARILEDHLPYGCRHWLFASNSARCYLVVKDFARRRGGWRSDILYASNHPLLCEHAASVAQHLIRDQHSLVTVDARFMPRPPEGALLEPLPTPRYCFSDRVPRASYAGIYSEAVLLDYEV